MNTTASHHAFTDTTRPIGLTTPTQLRTPGGPELGAYTHRGLYTCPYCTAGAALYDITSLDDLGVLLDALLVKPLEEANHVIDYAVETLLDTLAEATGTDREHPATFAEYDFPKILTPAEIATTRPGYDSCDNCGADYS